MSKFFNKLARKLQLLEPDQKKFELAVTEGLKLNSCIVWTKPRPNDPPFDVLPVLKNQPHTVDRMPSPFRPGKHALHEQGFYYSLDYASVLMCLPLQTINPSPRIIFDVCASPGGKSAMVHSLFHPEVLIANEVMGNRCGALISNLKRCEIPSIVMSRDTEVLKEHFGETADLVIVDAPCSGQSLLVKKETAPGCFHPTNVNKCMNRQRRIIANSSALVKPQGYLLYSTCTYSPEENEELCEWFISKFSYFETVEISSLQAHQSKLTPLFTYRFFPGTETGAGGFTCLLRNKKEGAQSSLEIPESMIRWQLLRQSSARPL